jgi:SAM-dependent methyltransferase
MLARLLMPFRRLRGAAAKWSSTEDSRFHDALFETHNPDAFDESYAGYITIRRFADLAEQHLRDAGPVLDLGCGPGEITCELARRHPSVEFRGVDHSPVAIDRARETANRLHLSNVAFEAADIAAFAPHRSVELVMMFDAFHHLIAPQTFVQTASRFTDRFFLIEPAGDVLGRWRRTLDFDWLPSELDKIRARLENALGHEDENAPAAPSIGALDSTTARAVENRYPAEDFERFFEGFSLSIRGTVAGLDIYPPQPNYTSGWRSHVMGVAYDLICAIDDDLFRRGLDMYAKHWAIYASRGENSLQRTPLAGRSPRIAPVTSEQQVQGAFDAEYIDASVPPILDLDTELMIDVTVNNRSWRTWSSSPPAGRVFASYHWLTNRRTTVIRDGLRSSLPRPILPGASCRVALRVRTPPQPGEYLLAFDLVEEGVSWFSEAGTPPLRAPVRVG